MNVRGVQIEVVAAAAEGARAEATAAPDAVTADERAVRAACAAAISDAAARGAASVAMPAYGIRAGMSAITSGKICVQEAIRAAREGRTSVRRIALCCADPSVFGAFERTVNGYLRHLMEVLIWGPFVTVDAIIEVPAGIVLVKRSNPPLGHALPGGFEDYGESLEDAVRREAREETGLVLDDLRQFHTYSDPSRDPRFQTVTTVFSARSTGTPRAGDDAADVWVVPASDLSGVTFAFDHGQVLQDWLSDRWSTRGR